MRPRTTQHPRRTIAVGDIHGCSRALEALLAAISPTDDDLLITLGDYVDRGPDTCGVIDQLIELPNRCRVVSLMGNHEIMLLASLEAQAEMSFWLGCGGVATLDSYGGSLEQIPDEHLNFLRNCHRYYETRTHIFVHANYAAGLPIHEQPDQLLFWEHMSYDSPPPHESGKIAVVGHTPQPTGEILDLEHLLCIDTCCFGGGWLTALDVQSGQVWQADISGTLRSDSPNGRRH